MKRADFPLGFRFGTATSSYQIEGTDFGDIGDRLNGGSTSAKRRQAVRDLIERLEETGDWEEIDRAAEPAAQSDLEAHLGQINSNFCGETLADILRSLEHSESEWAEKTRKTLNRNAPLAMAATVELVHRARLRDRIDEALKTEFRFAYRIAEMGDFQEGIRAAIIDKDRVPKWRHAKPEDPTPAEVSAMLRPLGQDELKLEEQP